MAEEIVNLASFEFDTQKIEQSLESLQNSLFDIQQEQKRYSNSNKILQKEYDDLAKQQLELKKSKQEESAAYKEITAKMAGLTEQQKGLFKSQKDLQIQASLVNSEYNKTVSVQKTLMDSNGALYTANEALTNALQRENLTISQARKSNSELIKLRNELNPKIKEEADLIQKLNQKLDENNIFIRENASAYEQQKINIGNYSESIKNAFNDLNIFNGGLGGFISRSQEAGGVGNLLTTSLKTIGAGIVGVTKSSLAFIATPIGAVIAALGLVIGGLVSYLNSTQEGIDKVTAVTRPLMAIFDSLIGVTQVLGKKLFEALSNPKQLLTDLVDFVKNNVMNRFKAFGVVLEGIMNLDFKKVADGVLQGVSGVENLTDKISNAADATGKFLDESIKKGQELDRLEKELTKTRIANKTALGALTEELKQQNKIAEDASLPLKEREAAAFRSIQVAKETNALKQKELDLEIAILRNKQSRNDTSDAENEALQELIAKKNESNAAALEIETTQKTKLNSIRKDANNRAIALEKERVDNAIKAMQTELDFYIESQGERKKSMEEQLKIDQEIMAKELAISKANFEAKKINRKEYELEQLQIKNDFLAKETQLTIDNANLELQIFKDANQRKIEANQFFSAELLLQEKIRLDAIAQAERDNQKLLFDEGLINAKEYATAIATIDAENYEAKKVVEEERKVAEKDKALADQIIQDELNAERFDFDLQLQLERYEREYALRKAEAEKNGADMIAFEENEAKKKQLIQETVQSNKLQLASQTFGNLIALAGKESAVGKALAIAQTTIDTYQSATAAYKSLAGIPVVGPALGGIAAGVAVASGLANVKKIASVQSGKTPGYALGGKITEGTAMSSPNGDNVYIGARLGEAILNESQQRAIGTNTLANAGVPGFGGSGSAVVQNNLESNANNAMMATMIADAVMVGAERGTASGSERGLVGLSDNRQIMENAKF